MATGKNIEIKIAAIGGDQAADQFGKASDAASEMEENVSKISRVQQAQAVSQLAVEVGKVGVVFQEVARDVEAFDAELAETLRNAGKGIETVSSGLSAVAMGFAVGGPIGAAAGALTVVISEVGKAWIASETAAAKAAGTQTKLFHEQQDAAREARQEIEAKNEAAANASVLVAIKSETEAAREYTSELQRQVALAREKRRLESEVLDAQDRSQLAQVDLDETTGKLSGAEAAEKRAEIEAASRKRARDERKRQAAEDAVAAKAQADAESKAAQETARQAAELAAKKEEAASKTSELETFLEKEKPKMVRNKEGNFSPYDQRFLDQINDEIKQAKQLLADLEKASAEANETAADASKKSEISSRGAVDAAGRAVQTVQAVDAVQSEDDKRRSTIRANREAAAAKVAEQKAQRQRLQSDIEARENAIDATAQGSSRKFGDAGRRVGGGLGDALTSIGKKLENENNQKEIEALAAKFAAATQGMGGSTIAALKQMLATQQAQAKEIGILQQQLKNSRITGMR
jgi:hypothetical protein